MDVSALRKTMRGTCQLCGPCLAVTVLLTFMCAGSLSAQSPAPVETVQFRCLAWERLPYRLAYRGAGGDFIRLELSKIRRSPEYIYKGVQPIEFYDVKDLKAAKVSGVPAAPLAAVTISPELDSPLLLFVPAPEGSSEALKVVALEDSEAIFPFGSYKVHNLSGAEIRGRFGDAEFSLDRGQSIVVQPSGNEADNMDIYIAAREGEQWESAYVSVWTHRPNQRALLFINPSNDKTRAFFDINVVAERQALSFSVFTEREEAGNHD